MSTLIVYLQFLAYVKNLINIFFINGVAKAKILCWNTKASATITTTEVELFKSEISE